MQGLKQVLAEAHYALNIDVISSFIQYLIATLTLSVSVSPSPLRTVGSGWCRSYASTIFETRLWRTHRMIEV